MTLRNDIPVLRIGSLRLDRDLLNCLPKSFGGSCVVIPEGFPAAWVAPFGVSCSYTYAFLTPVAQEGVFLARAGISIQTLTPHRLLPVTLDESRIDLAFDERGVAEDLAV